MQVIFRHTSFAENREACVDTRFWHSQKHNEEGLKWKSEQSEKVPYRQKEKL